MRRAAAPSQFEKGGASFKKEHIVEMSCFDLLVGTALRIGVRKEAESFFCGVLYIAGC